MNLNYIFKPEPVTCETYIVGTIPAPEWAGAKIIVKEKAGLKSPASNGKK